MIPNWQRSLAPCTTIVSVLERRKMLSMGALSRITGYPREDAEKYVKSLVEAGVVKLQDEVVYMEPTTEPQHSFWKRLFNGLR